MDGSNSIALVITDWAYRKGVSEGIVFVPREDHGVEDLEAVSLGFAFAFAACVVACVVARKVPMERTALAASFGGFSAAG